MKPLNALGGGLIVIAIDFRLDALDILPDPIGWLFVAFACHRLFESHLLAALSLLGGVLAVPGVIAEYHLEGIEAAGPSPNGTGSVIQVEVLVYDQLTGLRLALSAAGVVLIGVVVHRVVRTLERRAGPYVADRTVTRLRVLRLAALSLWVVPPLVGMAYGTYRGNGFDPVWNDPAARVALLGDISVLALVIALFSNAREPWARQPKRPDPTSATNRP